MCLCVCGGGRGGENQGEIVGGVCGVGGRVVEDMGTAYSDIALVGGGESHVDESLSVVCTHRQRIAHDQPKFSVSHPVHRGRY